MEPVHVDIEYNRELDEVARGPEAYFDQLDDPEHQMWRYNETSPQARRRPTYGDWRQQGGGSEV